MPRLTKLTPERQDKIIQAIRAGNYNNIAAAYAGVNESTFYEWMKRGKDAKSGIYFQFFQAVKKAQADAEAAAVAIIRKEMPDTWQAAAWYLERKYAERWGRQVIDNRHSGNIQLSWGDNEDNDA